jgi:capsular polysaccharide biosynthesis protein
MTLVWDDIWRPSLAGVSRLREARIRRLAYGGFALIFALFCLFPRPYVARAKVLPQGEGGSLSSLLSSMGGGGLQNFAALFGNHQSIEVYLAVARSQDVLADACRRLHLEGHGDADSPGTEVRLARKVDVGALAGGIIEMDVRDYSPEEALQIATAYSAAFQNRLLVLARQHIVQKKSVLDDRMHSATVHLAQAEGALNRFQSTHKLAAPQAQLGAAVARQAGLQAALQVKQTELSAALSLGTGQSIRAMEIQSEITSLRHQLEQSETNEHAEGLPNLAGMSEISYEYIDLYRNVQFAQAVVEAYERYGEEVAAEDVSTTTDATVQVVEEPNVDPRRQYNIIAVGLLLALIVIAFYTECYVPLARSGGVRAVER